jgi:hypothetical protein
MLRLGQLSFGRHGAPDFQHARLFTLRTLRRLLNPDGPVLARAKDSPGPFAQVLGGVSPAHFLHAANQLLIYRCSDFFNYQVSLAARSRPALEYLLQLLRSDTGALLDRPS